MEANYFIFKANASGIELEGRNTRILFYPSNPYFHQVGGLLVEQVEKQNSAKLNMDLMESTDPDNYYKLQAYVDYADVVED